MKFKVFAALAILLTLVLGCAIHWRPQKDPHCATPPALAPDWPQSLQSYAQNRSQFEELLSDRFEVFGCSGKNNQKEAILGSLRHSLQVGISCLAKMNKERQKDAAGILSFFSAQQKKKVRIACANDDTMLGLNSDGLKVKMSKHSYGEDFGCLTGYHPALAIREDLDPALRPYVMFHEMFHWLGYRHGRGVDVTYLAPLCCFVIKPDEISKEACSLLNETKDWTSVEYQSRFAALMDNMEFITAGMEGVIHSVLAQKSTDPELKFRGLYRAAMELAKVKSWMEDGKVYSRPMRAVLALLYAKVAASGFEPNKKNLMEQEIKTKIIEVYFPKAESSSRGKLKLIEALSLVISAGIGATAKENLSINLQNFSSVAEEICPSLTKKDVLLAELVLESLPVYASQVFREWDKFCKK